MMRLLKFLLILFSLGLTIVYMVLIWNLTFGHLIDEISQRRSHLKQVREIKAQKRQNTVHSLQKTLFAGNQRVKHYLGYRIIDALRLEGHFHHIDFEIKPDKRSYCIKCHGDMPHDKIKEVRAFWNMHSFFMACETCHVRFDEVGQTPVYKWYDRESGAIVESPVLKAKPGSYQAKIVPFERVDGNWVRIDSDARIEFANEFVKVEPTLNEFQKSKAIKLIHQRNHKQPYVCEDCHRKDKPVLSLQELGYPEERIASIESNEVVGMIEKYKTFYLPDLIKPGP